jgi:hypothetical protein
MTARTPAETELLGIAACVFPGGVIARHRLPTSGRTFIDYTCGGGHYFSVAHTDADVDRTVQASEEILMRIF